MLKVFTISGFLVGVGFLGLQFSLTVPARITNDGLLLGLAGWLAFLTILTNIGVVLCYASALSKIRFLAWFRSHRTRTMFVALIALVMVVYHFVLAPVWSPEGASKVADVGLHYVVPIIYICWWLLLSRRKKLNYDSIGVMLVAPVVYIITVMVRGALITQYPYFFLEPARYGYLQVIAHIGGLLGVILTMYFLAIIIDRLLFSRNKVIS